MKVLIREVLPASIPTWHWRTLKVSLVLLAMLLCWDASGLDLFVARMFGDVHGFPWRNLWLLDDVMHDGGRRLAWLFALALCMGAWWPVGWLNRLSSSERLQLAVTSMLAAGVVAALKSASATSCPWDLREFGGVAHHLTLWQGWRQTDGGAGHCFPTAHTSSGFAFVGGAFVFRRHPSLARVWLMGSITMGLLFGICQQMRGASFMSHTLWTGWICWVTAWLIDLAWSVSDRPTHQSSRPTGDQRPV